MERAALLLLPLVFVLACGNVRGPYPHIEKVEAGEATAIDGVWSNAGRDVVLRIDRGRVIAEEVFRTFFMRADPGVVVAVNVVQQSPSVFEGRGTLMNERWHMRLDLDGDMRVQVLRPTDVEEHNLRPVSLADESWFQAQIGAPHIVALAPVAAAPPPARRNKVPTPPSPPKAREPRRPDVDFGRYHALVVGNDAYENLPELATARRDARAVATLLEARYGFEVTLLEDATREDVLEGLRSMRQRLGPDDNLLIYYAGHGSLDEVADEGYWLPVDAERDNETHWIANSTISVYFRAIQAKHILVVSDSCFSGQLSRGIRVLDPTPSNLSNLARRRARVVMTSGGLEPVADGQGGSHSAFASAFLAVLGENEGVLDTSTLFERMKRPIMLAADQTPELADIRRAGHEGGDFLFVPTR
jgi:hypothetical protein